MLPDTNLIAISSLSTSISLSLVAQTVNNLPAMLETQARSLGQEDPLGREWLPTPDDCLGHPMDGGAWQATDHGIAKSGT